MLALLALGCGAPLPRATTPAAAEPAETVAAPVEAEVAPSEPAPTEPAPRLEVAPAADLAAAIAARLPTVELVPQSCGTSREPVALTGERVCVQDPATGLSRAMRRFTTSYDSPIGAARLGDDVVFGVQDLGMARTRYAGHLWRWSLGDDDYVGLAGLDDEGALFGHVRVQALDFGLLVRAARSEGEPRWFLFDGELHGLRESEGDLGALHVNGGHTYELHASRQREVLSTVRLDGARLVVERVTDYPRAWRLPLALHFPEGRALVVSAFPRASDTSLYVVEPPAAEVRELRVALRRPVEMRFDAGRVLLRDRAGWHAVDLTTGAVEPAEPSETPPAPPRPTPRAIHGLVLEPDALVLWRGSAHRLSAAGVEAIAESEAPPRSSPSGCRCEDASLRCGDEVITGACAHVADLERVHGGDDGVETRSTEHSPGGVIRFRVDRLEPDLTRLTRLSDGARLWVRVFDEGVLAQADDGAFVAPTGLSLDGFALRWGRSLLDAPVTPLAPHEEQFLRPTLIEDFFAGRPLPAADTTLPAG